MLGRAGGRERARQAEDGNLLARGGLLDVKAVGICIVGHRGKAFYISRQMKPNAIGGLPSGAIFLSTENKDKILCILRNGLTSHC